LKQGKGNKFGEEFAAAAGSTLVREAIMANKSFDIDQVV
jgi:hypothetical protein